MTYEDFKKKYPDLLENVYCGFDLPEGWEQLLDTLFENITNYVKGIKDHNKWVTDHLNDPKITNKDILKLKDELNPKVSQVKSKFAGLRCYTDDCDDYIRGMIDLAESMSFNICEDCGNPGEVISGGWLWTLCPNCKSKRNK